MKTLIISNEAVTIRAGQDFNAASFLFNFEIPKYYQTEPRLNSFYSINNLPRINDRTYIVHFDEYKKRITHWVALCVIENNASRSFEHIPK